MGRGSRLYFLFLLSMKLVQKEYSCITSVSAVGFNKKEILIVISSQNLSPND